MRSGEGERVQRLSVSRRRIGGIQLCTGTPAYNSKSRIVVTTNRWVLHSVNDPGAAVERRFLTVVKTHREDIRKASQGDHILTFAVLEVDDQLLQWMVCRNSQALAGGADPRGQDLAGLFCTLTDL